MGYLLVAGIARVLGKNPQDLWSYTTKWIIRFLLVLILITISFAGAGVVFGKEKSGDPKVPAITTTVDSTCSTTRNESGDITGMGCYTPTVTN